MKYTFSFIVFLLLSLTTAGDFLVSAVRTVWMERHAVPHTGERDRFHRKDTQTFLNQDASSFEISQHCRSFLDCHTRPRPSSLSPRPKHRHIRHRTPSRFELIKSTRQFYSLPETKKPITSTSLRFEMQDPSVSNKLAVVLQTKPRAIPWHPSSISPDLLKSRLAASTDSSTDMTKQRHAQYKSQTRLGSSLQSNLHNNLSNQRDHFSSSPRKEVGQLESLKCSRKFAHCRCESNSLMILPARD